MQGINKFSASGPKGRRQTDMNEQPVAPGDPVSFILKGVTNWNSLSSL
jgi:hypothetical protein